MASDLLALLDTLDGLHKAATDSTRFHATKRYDFGESAYALWPELSTALRTALTPTTDGEREVREALADFDRSNAVPPCRLCGKALTLQSADAFCRTWACEGGDWRKGHWSAFDDTPERTMADQHYSRSQFEQRPSGMAEHLRTALALLATERAKAADAARERDELRAALLNESGQGDPPSEGWAFADPDPLGAKPCDYGMEFRVWMKGDVLLRRTDHTPAWRTYRLNEGWCAVAFGPAYDTAREAMKAADAHTKVTP